MFESLAELVELHVAANHSDLLDGRIGHHVGEKAHRLSQSHSGGPDQMTLGAIRSRSGLGGSGFQRCLWATINLGSRPRSLRKARSRAFASKLAAQSSGRAPLSSRSEE